MKLYFAPLEGITTYVYRNTHKRFFGGCDAYFSPFITPSDNVKIGRKGFRDILPENNAVPLKIQVLTNNSLSFLKFAKKAEEYGYEELNLNLGCPSSTVTGKGRGAGFLQKTEELDRFLFEVFSKCDMKISVKTRAGYFSTEEIKKLIEIYNKYDISCLTVHPRSRNDFYKGVPDMEAFKYAYTNAKMPLCYNGNVFSVKDYEKITENFPNTESVMIGRGAVTNPAIFREIRGGEKLGAKELKDFTAALAENYGKILDSEIFTLHKLKEIWLYIAENSEDKKIKKGIKKAGSLKEFMNVVSSVEEV